MKICILGDTHFGARNSSTQFSKYFGLFYEEILFPYLKRNDVQCVFQLGDLFDTRKYINMLSLHDAKVQFFDRLVENKIDFSTLLGNHDIFYRESLSINSPEQVLGEYDFNLVKQPTTVLVGTTSIDLIPWICKGNYEEVSAFIKNSKSDLCFGHFEIDGFAMYRGLASHGGLSASLFEKYEAVFSGHFHTRSHKGNITYVGTPYEITWQDCQDPRGFYIFDTDTRRFEFIENPHTIHVKLEYDESEIPKNISDYKDKYVRVVVTNKTDLKKFDLFMTELQSVGAHDIKVIENLTAFKDGTVDEDIDIADTLSIMESYVESVDTTENKEKILSYMKSLFVEAINLDD